jgi:uncharacterized membrane protein
MEVIQVNKNPGGPEGRPILNTGQWIALGAGAGLVFGAAFRNPGIGLVLGAAAGLMYGQFANRSKDD